MKRDTEFETLYQSNIGGTSWYSGISEEAKAWLHQLTEFIDGKGKDPQWVRVHERFTELFPKDAPKVAGTISATVRRLRG
jgi:hypothetical protein